MTKPPINFERWIGSIGECGSIGRVSLIAGVNVSLYIVTGSAAAEKGTDK